MTRTSLVGVGAIAAAALVLSGCSAGGDDTPSDGPVELVFWHGYTEADGDVLEGIVDSFNDSQDEVHVSTEVNTWATINDTLLPALSSKTGPDLVALPAENFPVYAAKKAFVSLDDFYADAANNASDVVEGGKAMTIVDGTSYGIPLGFVPLAIYYDKAAFAEAGITEVPADWDAWVEAAKALTVDENGDGTPERYGIVLPDHATVGNGVWPSLFYGGGGDLVSDGEAVIDSSENADTLAFWYDAIVNDKISPIGVDGIEADSVFSSGKAAMTFGGPWMTFIAADAGIDYGIAPIPAGPDTQAASAIGLTLSVTDQGDDAKIAAAQKFLAYFLNDDNAAAWSLGSGWPPLRTGVPAEAVAENATVATLSQFTSFTRPLLPGVVNSVDVLSALDELTQRAMAGDDIDTLLAEAQSKVEAALADQ
ncbi:ABC transporter substrate-binding protein [Protaetiibacter intestinalis]|uniref:ABC transporter substrate-binding protein n=1 Tax=Protaetiibacter intestinalis TaxID=2419774 RepID=A0A387B8Q0_9MICO|nr:ABC transporter substrate-binding protein [Protaetiibacter intestinalis]AYF98201.1 ABC transporter substrate-binding protein [Protaetiibacter intestinalis]